jgi:hypothetical protein
MTYVTIVAIVLLGLSPLLIPLTAWGVHALRRFASGVSALERHNASNLSSRGWGDTRDLVLTAE